MSIPKEPRQLMINLMYLVLTALLALNVSAEVMNAFKTIDDSLTETSNTTTAAINDQQKALNKLLLEDSKKAFLPLKGGIEEVRSIVKDFHDYVNDVKVTLVDLAGNSSGGLDDEDYLYPENPAKKIVKGKKNKDVTTRVMVLGYEDWQGNKKDAEGPALEQKIAETKIKLVEAYSKVLSNEDNAKAFGFRLPDGNVDQAEVDRKIKAFENGVSLSIDEDWEAKSDGKKTSWADYRFRQMPMLPATTLLTTFQSDARNAEALAVGNLAQLAGGKEIVFDKFFPVINAKKGYVIKGEKFEAEISLGAYSSDIKPENIVLTVDGTRVAMKEDGIATYSKTVSSTGEKTIKLTARVTNPLTQEVSNESSEFKYEVGERSANVSADKMNVMYIGVDNPISVSAAGVSSDKVKVSASGAGINLNGGNGKYTATVSQPGESTITVSGGGLAPTPFTFRAKRIPDPVAKLGKKADGTMGTGEFKAQGGVIAWLENFDFDARCKIQGFNLVRVPKRQDPVDNPNRGGTYDAKSKRIVQAAKPGDIYYFENVKARCPGDKAGRKINSMVFRIK
jgi:gliding motility-associated protein GldM